MKKLSKTERVKQMLTRGIAPVVIADDVGVSKSYVYAVRGKMTKAVRNAERMTRAKARVAEMNAETNGNGHLPVAVAVNPLSVQVGGDHYKDMAIQPIQYIVANDLGFLEGCIIKRVSRWRNKGGIEDLQKIKHEVDLLIANANSQ